MGGTVYISVKISKMNDTLFIIIPAYNEEDNIANCIDDWYPIIESHDGGGSSRLVVVDDGSKDNTYEILCDLSKDRDWLIPLTKTNGGHGPALIYGYRYAIEQGADWIFQTDSDGQTNPNEFDAFWKSKDDKDAVIGIRPVRGDGVSRKFVENVVCFLLKIIFGVKVKDANAPYRLMRSNLVSKYLDRMPEDFNIPNIMLTTYCVYYKERTEFIPISFIPRQQGKSSINIKKIIRIGLKAISDFRVLKKNM